MTHNPQNDEPSRTFADALARARIERLLRQLSTPVVLCSGCGRPCAECDDGCNDALADWTGRPAA